MERRNPYIVLGIPFGASRDEAALAFADRAKKIRRLPDGATILPELTWALNQIDEVLRHPNLALHIYRVPADPSALVPSGNGVLNPRPEVLDRRTTSDPTDHEKIRENVGRELLRAVAFKLASDADLPER